MAIQPARAVHSQRPDTARRSAKVRKPSDAVGDGEERGRRLATRRRLLTKSAMASVNRLYSASLACLAPRLELRERLGSSAEST
jgi:hypothetical protein